MQEEVCIVPAPPVCLLPVCSYARLTAYFGILPTRLPILPERDFTPSSSARGATLAVLASSVSRILPGQEYSIVTAIAAGGTYYNVPLLIPQGQKRKMFPIAEIFLKLFFCTEKATRPQKVGWLLLSESFPDLSPLTWYCVWLQGDDKMKNIIEEL